MLPTVVFVCASVLCKCVCSSYVWLPMSTRRARKEKKGSPRIPPGTRCPDPPQRMMEARASLALQQGIFCSSFSTSTFSPGKKQDGGKEKKVKETEKHGCT